MNPRRNDIPSTVTQRRCDHGKGVPFETGLALAGGIGLAEVLAKYRKARVELKQNGLALLLEE